MTKWIDADLASLVATIESGGRPKGGASEDGGDVPSLGGENIRQTGGIDLDSMRMVPSAFFRRMTKGVLQDQDVLINKDGANTGKVGLYEACFPEASINEHVFLLRGQRGKLAQGFLYYLLLSQIGQMEIRGKISGSAQPGLKSSFIKDFPISVPTDVKEQAKIAQVLATLDRAIAQTDALLAKQQRVKAGLMQELLTRGIDADGRMRSAQVNASALYSGWQVRRLGDVAEVASGLTLGRVLDGPNLLVLPYLRVFNVQDGYFDLSDVKTVAIRPNELSRFCLQKGDVLMNEGGDFDKLGRGAVWNGQIKLCLHQNHVFRVRTNRKVLLPDFLALISASAYGKAFFVLHSKQSTNLASINSTQLKSFPIPCPDVEEQERILKVAGEQNAVSAATQNSLRKMQALKAGLMQDLLTGRVSVLPLLNESIQV